MNCTALFLFAFYFLFASLCIRFVHKPEMSEMEARLTANVAMFFMVAFVGLGFSSLMNRSK